VAIDEDFDAAKPSGEAELFDFAANLVGFAQVFIL